MNRSRKILTLVIACYLGSVSVAHAVQQNLIEFSKLSTSDTLFDASTLGFFSNFEYQQDYVLYAGVELALFQEKTMTDGEMTTRVVMGMRGLGVFSPYAEIGVGLLDLLFRNKNQDTSNCTDQQQCDPDLHFRVGLRISVAEGVGIGLFHEDVHFGDFQDKLTGSHSYTGTSINVQF